MKKLMIAVAAFAIGGCWATVDEHGRRGGGQATLTLGLPAVLPPLIVIHPGVSIVGDFDEEVFFADGYYWARRDGAWIRARDHRGGWSRVEARHVPAPLVKSPPGRYRRYRGEQHRRGGEDHGDRGDRRRGEGDDR